MPNEPPPYLVSSTGFPESYFVIKNLGTRKVLDIERDQKGDGTEAILWPESEGSRVLGFRNPLNDNQVFFVDYSGALCSKSSGHALDVEKDGRIVLRHRRPVVPPFPNSFSHPLPQFNYSPKTCQLSVTFPYSPTPPGTNISLPSERNRRYILTSIPLRKPRGLLDDATDFFQGAASIITSPFALALGIHNNDPTASVNAAEVQRGEIDLREEELLEADRVEEDSVDDSPSLLRRVRVISLEENANEGVDPKTRERRRWEIIPLLKTKALTGTI